MGYHIYAIGKAIRALFADQVTFINNFFLLKICLVPVWHLATEMQLFILSPIFIFSGVATIEATEAAALVKMLNSRLSRPEFWHSGFSTQTLPDSIAVPSS